MKIIESDFAHSARYRDEGHAAERSADHAEGYHPPFAAAVAYEKRFVVGMARCIKRNAEQQSEIRQDDDKQ